MGTILKTDAGLSKSLYDTASPTKAKLNGGTLPGLLSRDFDRSYEHLRAECALLKDVDN